MQGLQGSRAEGVQGVTGPEFRDTMPSTSCHDCEYDVLHDDHVSPGSYRGGDAEYQ